MSDSETIQAVDDLSVAWDAFLATAIEERRMCRITWLDGGQQRQNLVPAGLVLSFISGITMRATLDTLPEMAEPPADQKVDVRFLEEHYWACAECPRSHRWGPALAKFAIDGHLEIPTEALAVIRGARISKRLIRIDYWSLGVHAGGLEVQPKDAMLVLDGYREAARMSKDGILVTMYREGP